jgi:diguanylate cyclase (GGDEF)-like protein
LRAAVRAGDMVARFGGDEFAALVQCGPDGRAARDVAHRLRRALTRPCLLLGSSFTVGASIGVAFWRPGVTAAELMREADLAMYEAKAEGKGRVVIYQSPVAVHGCEPLADDPAYADGTRTGPLLDELRNETTA